MWDGRTACSRRKSWEKNYLKVHDGSCKPEASIINSSNGLSIKTVVNISILKVLLNIKSVNKNALSSYSFCFFFFDNLHILKRLPKKQKGEMVKEMLIIKPMCLPFETQLVCCYCFFISSHKCEDWLPLSFWWFILLGYRMQHFHNQ